MTRHLTATGLAISILTVMVLAKDESAGSIPAAMVEKLVQEDAKFIQKTLGKAPLKDKNARKVKAAALLIAAYCQMSQDKVRHLPAWRDAALKLIAAVDEGKVPAQIQLAALFSAKDESVEPRTGPLHKHLKLEYVMRVFSSPQVGGFGVEKDLETLIDSKAPLADEEKNKALLLAYKSLTLGHLIREYVPAEDEGKKTRKSWLEFAAQMHKASQGLVEAVNTGKNVSAAADKLALTCTKCHDVFR